MHNLMTEKTKYRMRKCKISIERQSSGGTRLQTRISLEYKVCQRVLFLETCKLRHLTSILKNTVLIGLMLLRGY